MSKALFFSGSTEDKIMTYTTQPVSRASIEHMENVMKTEAEEITCDILAVCDSLNKLCEVLSRLEYVLKRRNIEISLARKGQAGIT